MPSTTANTDRPRLHRCVRALAMGAVLLLGPSALAQGPRPAPDAIAPAATPVPPSWSSPRLERLGLMLAGNWRTDASVPLHGGEGETASVVLSVAPIGVEGMPNAMYLEIARADAMWAPYRQAVLQLFEYKGNIRLRTYEFHNANVDKAAFIGAWAMPEAFPPLKAEHFIATLDIEGTDASGGFVGRTPAPYPTAVGGAVEMTSSMELSGDRLITEDRGFDAQGNIAWGQEAGGRYTFSKVSPEGVVSSVRRTEEGLVVVEYRSGTGSEGQAGDTIAVHYTGWFAVNASVFDSSRTRGIPFSYQLPGNMIQGWLKGTEGMRPGARRRVYIPYALGYGEAGQPPRMPARSNLIFDVECLSIQPTPAPNRPAQAPPANNNAVDAAGNPG